VEFKQKGTRNLPLCNGTIIVLKISLLHSVSVITNFVIPKRDKKQNYRNEYASPPRQCNTGRPHWAIL